MSKECSIQVAVRTRPLQKGETRVGEILITDDHHLQFEKKTFNFDHVFMPSDTNKGIYDRLISSKLEPLLKGFNVTILAYGPTGSGKTYTMGTDNMKSGDPGIIPRALEHIYESLNKQKDIKYTVKVSFLELYKEDIFDLLAPSKKMCQLREDADGIKVSNLTEEQADTVQEALHALSKGSSFRHTSSTARNSKSSRSHGIYTVTIDLTNEKAGQCKTAKFQLVDLAGSERVGHSKTTGDRLQEGIKINLGLMTLSKVIGQLKDKSAHVSYRESKLTRLLQDSLGGNSLTVMIACISPSTISIEETLNTLRYASQARAIENRPVENTDPPAVIIKKLREQLIKMQQAGVGTETTEEITKLKNELESCAAKLHETMEAKIKVDDKYSNLIEEIEVINEEFKAFFADLTIVALENPSFKDSLRKAEEISKLFLKLTVYEGAQSNEGAQDESSDFDTEDPTIEFFCDDEDLDSLNQQMKDIKNSQDTRNRELELVIARLESKNYHRKALIDLQKQFNIGDINEDYINSLKKKIEELVNEKNSLMDKLSDKNPEERTKLYEHEIKTLQKELSKKTVALKTKEESIKKLEKLQNEIKSEKKMKADLMKKIRLDNQKYARLERESQKERVKLEKELKQKAFQTERLRNTLENQINVLRRKYETAQASLKSKATLKKTQLTTVKTKLPKEKDNVSEGSDEVGPELDLLICKMVARTAWNANQNRIKSLEDEIKEKSKENILQIHTQDSQLKMLREKSIDLQKIMGTEEEEKSLLNRMTLLPRLKDGVQHLIRRCVTEEVEKQKEKEIYMEQIDSLQNSEVTLKKEADNLKEELFKKTKMYEDKITKIRIEADYNNMTFSVETSPSEGSQETASSSSSDKQLEFDKLIALHTIAESSREIDESSVSDRQPLECITNLSTEKMEDSPTEIAECTIKEHNDYSKLSELYRAKCEEVETLKEKLAKQQKKTKKSKRKLTGANSAELSMFKTEEMFGQSFTDEFLNVDDDTKDPDFRATPLHKRRKKEPKETVSMTKKPCNCRSNCEKCKCRQMNAACSSLCGCKIQKCSNRASSSDVVMEEVK